MSFFNILSTRFRAGSLFGMLVMLGLSLALFGMPFDRQFAEHCFYTASGIALTGILFECWHLHTGSLGRVFARLDPWLLAAGLLMLILSQLFWLHRFTIDPPFEWLGTYLWENCIFWACSILLTLYIVLFNRCTLQGLKTFLVILFLAALVVLAVKGLHQHHQGIERISLKVDHPVPAGLVFSTLALALSAMALRWFPSPYKYSAVIIALFCGGVLVVLTQTRSALLMLVLLALVLIWKLIIKRFQGSSIVPWLTGIALMCMALGVAFFMNDRFYAIYSDLHNYAHGNQGGSLGARLVMWKAGLKSFMENPWGYSPTDRYAVVKGVIQSMTRNDPQVGVLISGYAEHHVHNEIIEILSLEGIVGLLGVIAFHGAMIVVAWRKQLADDFFRLFVGFLILFGISDPLFDSDKVGLLVSIAMPLFMALATPDRIREFHHTTGKLPSDHGDVCMKDSARING